MGIMGCSKNGCENIMCDRYSELEELQKLKT